MAKTKAFDEAARDAAAEQTQDLLAEAWGRWGRVEPDVISYGINPTFMGAPRWPGLRQAYRVVKKGDVVLIASDGLAEPYDEGQGPPDQNGIGLEIFAATDDRIARDGVGATVVEYGATWLHDLVVQVAQTAASGGSRLAELIDELGLLTMECWDVRIPSSHAARFVNSEGRVAVLMSLGASPIPTYLKGPLSPIRLVHLQLLTLAELDYVLEHGDAGRKELAKRLVAQKVAPLSRLDRPSVFSD